jgi:hypothetical protein
MPNSFLPARFHRGAIGETVAFDCCILVQGATHDRKRSGLPKTAVASMTAI